MNFLSFLIVITSGLLVCKFGLLLLEYERTPVPPTCVCFCSDATMISEQLTSRVEYRGPRQSTCECRDFLVPKLRQYMSFATPNGTCQVCLCEEASDARQKECFDLNLTVDIFLYTVIATTLLMAVMSTLRYYCCCSKLDGDERSRSRPSRNKYIHIGADQIVRLTKEQKTRLLGREPRALEDQMIAIKTQHGTKTEYSIFLI